MPKQDDQPQSFTDVYRRVESLIGGVGVADFTARLKKARQRAIKKGELVEVAKPDRDFFIWLFKHLNRKKDIFPWQSWMGPPFGEANLSLPPMTVTASSHEPLPESYEGLRALALSLMREKNILSEENADLKNRVASLQTKKERQREIGMEHGPKGHPKNMK